jgi:hypothetical protein
MDKKTLSTFVEKQFTESLWRNVPNLIKHYAKEASASFAFIKTNYEKLPYTEEGYGNIWFNPETQGLFFNLGKTKDLMKLAAWKNVIQNTPGIEYMEYSWDEEPNGNQPWVPLKPLRLAGLFEKLSEEVYSPNYVKSDAELKNEPVPEQPHNPGTQPFRFLSQISGHAPGTISSLLGGPSPLSATIAGGLLGAGLGYGTGTLLENILPNKYIEKGKLRKTLGLAGGGIGLAPGILWGAANYQNGQPLTGELVKDALDKLIPEECRELNEMFKAALEETPATAGAFDIAINTNRFNDVLWSPTDPYTPPALRAATSGLVEAAGEHRGSPWITPMDIAKIALGAGSGLTSGLFVGKTLGALAGLTPAAQETLQQIGVWTGVLKSTVPMVFGR